MIKKSRKPKKQQAVARRHTTNIVNIEAKINRRNEKSLDKAAKAQSKIEKQQRKTRKRKRSKQPDPNAILSPGLSRLLKIGVALFILALLFRTGYNIYDLKKQEKEALALQDQLLLQEKELQKMVSIKDTPEYVEQQARNVLHMIKPGEILYIPDPDAKAKNRQNASSGALNAKPPAEELQQSDEPSDNQADETDETSESE